MNKHRFLLGFVMALLCACIVAPQLASAAPLPVEVENLVFKGLHIKEDPDNLLKPQDPPPSPDWVLKIEANLVSKQPRVAGETVTLRLEPGDPRQRNLYYMYDYQRMRTEVYDTKNTDVKTADVTYANDRMGFTYTITEGATQFDTLTYTIEDLRFDWNRSAARDFFTQSANNDLIQTDAEGKKYTDITYTLKINDEQVAKAVVRVFEPEQEFPGAGFYRKLGGPQKMGDNLLMQFSIDFSFTTSETNEIVIYDMPDVDMKLSHLSDQFSMVWMLNKETQGKGNPKGDWSYLPFNKEKGGKGSAEVLGKTVEYELYDVYYKATNNGVTAPRQAEWTEESFELSHKDPATGQPLPDNLRVSAEPAITPENVLLVKPMGTELTAEEKAMLDNVQVGDARGFSTEEAPGAVGQGFKLVLRDMPHSTKPGADVQGGFFRLHTYWDCLHYSEIFKTAKGDPVFINAASIYAQDIPSTDDGDPNDGTGTGGGSGRQLKVERSKVSDSMTNRYNSLGLNIWSAMPQAWLKSTGTNDASAIVKYRAKKSDPNEANLWLHEPRVYNGLSGETYDVSDDTYKLPSITDAEGQVWDLVGVAEEGSDPETGTLDKNVQRTIIFEYVKHKDETNPGTDPGTDPGTNPGTNPDTDPETEPNTDPGTSEKPNVDPKPKTDKPQPEQPKVNTSVKPVVPRTGDFTNAAMLFAVAVSGIALIASAALIRKHRNQ